MQVRTYTERSNARRAAKAAGVDPALVFATDDGFTFPAPAEEAAPKNGGHDQVDTKADAGDIPAFLRRDPLTPEQEAELREKTRRATSPEREIIVRKTMPKAKAAESKTAKGKGGDKNAMLLKMLSGKGSSVEAMTKALDWLPHTLRARISRLNKPKRKGGEGFKIDRTRVDGITNYRISA